MNKFQAEVDLALKAPDAKNLEKTLEQILASVEKLPKTAGTASKAVEEIVKQIEGIGKKLKEGISLNAVIGDVKQLSAAMKSLQTLSKGLELFSNKDVQNINDGAKAIRQAAAAYETLQRGSKVSKSTFGLDAKTVKETSDALRSLQTEYKALQQVALSTGRLSNSDAARSEAIRRNVAALESYRAQLIRNTEAERYALGVAQQGDRMKDLAIKARAEQQKQQEAYARAIAQEGDRMKNLSIQASQNAQDGRKLAGGRNAAFANSDTGRTALTNRADFQNSRTARWADTSVVERENAAAVLRDTRQQLSLDMQRLGIKAQDGRYTTEQYKLLQQIRALEKQQFQERIANGGQTDSANSAALSKRIENLRAQLRIQTANENKSNPLTRQAQEQERAESMIARTTGTGGAALLKVQLALMANYAVINTVLGSIRAAASNSVELEAAFANLRAVTDTTKTEMVGLEDKIKSVAASSKFSAVEVANAALILGQAGLSAKQVADALPSVVTLANAAGTSLANAVDLVTSIVGVFDKQATDTADVANKITAAANNSKISVEKLALAFQYVGNAAAQTGVSFEETTAALATMSNAGIKSGSTLGTGLRQFLTEVQKPSEDFLESLRRVGLTISDIDIRSHGLVGVTQRLRDAGFVASDAIKSFDVRSAAAFNALIANPGQFEQQLKLLTATEAAVKANAIQMDTFDAQSKRLTTNVNNLVASGLEPLQRVLTIVFQAFSNVLSAMAPYQGVLAAITSGTILYLGIQVASHLAGIAAGWFAIGGAAGTAATAVAGLRTVTVAATAASVASTVANLASGVAFRAMAASAAASVAQVGLVRAVLATVTVELRALWVVLTGMSLATGIGIAFAAVAAGIYFLGGRAEESKRKLDELKASVDESKSSYDSAQSSVDSLTKKIADLYYRQDSLEGNTKALSLTSMELNAQFGNLGLRIDSNSSSLGTMIGKLQETRSEMQLLAGVKLASQVRANEALFQAQATSFSKSIGGQGLGQRGLGGNTAADRMSSFLDGAGVFKSDSLTSQGRTNLGRDLQTFKDVGSGKITGDEAAAALIRASASLEAAGNVLSGKQKDSFNALAAPLRKAIVEAAEYSQKKAAVDESKLSVRSNSDRAAFNAAPIFGGKTFEQALPKDYDVQGRVKKNTPIDNEVDLFYQTKKLIEVEMERVEAVKRVIRDKISSEGSSEALTKALAEAEIREQEFKSQGKRYYDTVKSRLEAQTKDDAERLAIMKRDKSYSADERAAFARIAAQRKADFQTAGAFGSNERAESAAKRKIATGEADAHRILNAPDSGGADAAYKQAQQQAADAATKEAIELEKRSKGGKLSAEMASSVDEANELLDKAIEDLVAAKAKRVEASIASSNARVAPKNRTPATNADAARSLAATESTAQEAADQLAAQRGKISAGVEKRANALGPKAAAQRVAEQIKALQNQAEENLLEISEPLLAIRMEIAQGVTPEGTTAQKQAELNITKQRLRDLNKQLQIYPDYIAKLQNAVAQAAADVDELDAKRNDPDLSPAEKRQINARLGVAQGTLKTAEADLYGGRKGQSGLKKDIRDNQITEAAQTEAMPKPENWEALSAAVEKSVNSYAKFAASYDTVGEIGKGTTGVLMGLQQSFSTLFTNIITGSMSAKEAFKSFALGIVKAMLDIVAQALAMAAIKALLRAMNLSVPGFSEGGPVGVNQSAGSGSGVVTAASGGALSGGVSGKDSIPMLGMPGEYMVKKSAVDAVGLDFMHDLNNTTENSVSTSKAGVSRSNSDSQGKVLNLWLVSPDQVPAMGPNDIMMTVMDNLAKNGSSFKTMVKQVALGNM